MMITRTEKNEEIHFTVSYKNNTDEIIKDFYTINEQIMNDRYGKRPVGEPPVF